MACAFFLQVTLFHSVYNGKDCPNMLFICLCAGSLGGCSTGSATYIGTGCTVTPTRHSPSRATASVPASSPCFSMVIVLNLDKLGIVERGGPGVCRLILLSESDTQR
jgi:hypothetical protein